MILTPNLGHCASLPLHPDKFISARPHTQRTKLGHVMNLTFEKWLDLRSQACAAQGLRKLCCRHDVEIVMLSGKGLPVGGFVMLVTGFWYLW